MAKDKKLTPDEEKELKAMEEAEAARVAAEAAAAAASAPPAPPLQGDGNEEVKKPAAAPPAPVLVGDIPVTCLKTEAHCVLGGRRYQLVKGREIMMDSSHADELASNGWVAKVEVVASR